MSERGQGQVEVASRLDAGAARVWAAVTSLPGVNHELRPILRMTAPPGMKSIDTAELVLGERLFRSWILLFGVLPIDYDDLTIVRLEPGACFLERSSMLSQRLWEHERSLEPDGAGCLLTDRLRFEPRGPIPPAAVAALVRRLFEHRHSRLRARFGGTAA